MITQASLFCAAAALVAALYFHGLQRLALVLKRKFHIPTRGLAMLPLIVLTIGLLYLEVLALQLRLPNLAGEIGSATLLGLAIGSLVPVSGGGLFARFGFGGDDGGDGGSDDQSGGDGGGH